MNHAMDKTWVMDSWSTMISATLLGTDGRENPAHRKVDSMAENANLKKIEIPSSVFLTPDPL